ncbi:olfactory receptor 6N1-like [Aquarana catesbeiana]|uniref:olfactory receptor 6N1-like n=1 Tax=Aquarana catesbeiana TaxID=8400 RepID=UPI003CCA54FF
MSDEFYAEFDNTNEVLRYIQLLGNTIPLLQLIYQSLTPLCFSSCFFCLFPKISSTSPRTRPSPIFKLGTVFKVNEAYLQSVASSNVTFTQVTEFIIFGFQSLQNYQILLFCVLLCIYLLTLSGNGSIFFLVIFDQHLHTPMYFFVGNLSFIDMSYTSVTIPKMLAKFLMNLDTISYNACFAQMYIFLSLGSTECLLLAVMAYDRYIAICSPLHYQTIMTRQLYLALSAVAWSGGFATPLTATLLALKLPYCGPNIIHHYYCDHPPLLQLACANTSFNVAVGSSMAAFLILISFTLVVISYIKIIIAILKISSHAGRKKTFSTCASHFAVVSLFFLPLIFMYVRPKASYSSDVDSLVAFLYTVLTPMMNPFIYSLRNKEIKEAFQRKISCKYAFF